VNLNEFVIKLFHALKKDFDSLKEDFDALKEDFDALKENFDCSDNIFISLSTKEVQSLF
jgi:hypothetical protein